MLCRAVQVVDDEVVEGTQARSALCSEAAEAPAEIRLGTLAFEGTIPGYAARCLWKLAHTTLLKKAA